VPEQPSFFNADEDRAELQRLRMIALSAERLVASVGDRGICSSAACRQEIWWIVHKNGKRAPYNSDGTNHFITCIDAPRFHKGKHAQEPGA
jgi:hypothetical protein